MVKSFLYDFRESEAEWRDLRFSISVLKSVPDMAKADSLRGILDPYSKSDQEGPIIVSMGCKTYDPAAPASL